MKSIKLTGLQADRAMRLKLDMQSGNKANGFLAAIVLNLNYVYSTEVPTAGVSNTTICVNPDFMFSDEWEADHRVFVMYHEAMHIVYDHISQRGKRDPQLWNIAGDYRINTDLLAMGFKRPPQGIFDDTGIYKTMTTAEIYEDLIAKNHKPEPGDGDWMDIDENMHDDSKPTADNSEAQQTVKDIIQNAMAIADSVPGGWGELPGDFVANLRAEESYKVSWQEVLAQIPMQIRKAGVNYKRFNRRHVHAGRYEPAIESKRVGTIAAAWDTSCSVGDTEISLMKGECMHLKDVLNPKRFEVLCFDTTVHTVHVLDEHDRIEDINIEGRGGTDLHPVFEHFSNQTEEEISCLIVFSDMECCPVKEEPPYPVYWIVINNPYVEVHFGTVVHFDTRE